MSKALQMPYKSQSDELSQNDKLMLGLLGAAGTTMTVVVIVNAIKHFNAKKSDAKSFEIGSAASYAKQISNAIANKRWFGVDMDTLRYVYRQVKTGDELKAIQAEYRRQNGNSEMNTDLGEALQPSELNELLQIMAGKSQPGQPLTEVQYKAWANRIYNAVNYRWGTDEEAIKAVFIEIPTQAAYAKLVDTYYKEYGATLKNDLLGDLELWEYPEYMNIISSKPTA